MKNVFVDTDIIINYSKGFGKNLIELFELKENSQVELYINPIIIAEFYADKNLLKQKEMERINKLFQMFQVIDISKEIGLLTGELLRTSQTISIADTFIAATCLHHDLLLATNNKKDFGRVKRLVFYTVMCP